jgi:hypothetical protein
MSANQTNPSHLILLFKRVKQYIPTQITELKTSTQPQNQTRFAAPIFLSFHHKFNLIRWSTLTSSGSLPTVGIKPWSAY